MQILTANKLKRYFRLGSAEVKALDGIDLVIEEGEFLTVAGASGSGKSTLLNLLAGLDMPTSGEIVTPTGPLQEMSSKRIARYRAEEIGMVFQSFNLIPHRTAQGNVEMALFFSRMEKSARKKKSADILQQLGLGERGRHKPSDLSGGEQQRVALARALVKNPQILFADEPTGNLDRDSSKMVAEILLDWKKLGNTVVMVTHNLDLAEKVSDRIVEMDYGKIVNERTISGRAK